jgi:hypothetical protein
MGDNEFVLQDGPKGLYRIWKKILFEPQEFYKERPAAGGFESPLIFAGVCGIFFLIMKITVAGLTDGVNAFFLVCLSYIFGPGILMLVSQFLFQGEGDYEGTLRTCAYAAACLVLAWIPKLGIIAFLYSFYLIFLGTENIHKLDSTKAAISTLIGILVTTAIMFFVLGEDRIRRPLL